jgi:exodeoxyribonuclease VII large subunit
MTLPLDFSAADGQRIVYTVAALNREARSVIEDNLGVVWVEGELSNLARPTSGHMYWTLKDENAQLRCAMFRQHNRQLGFEPRNGQQLLARGRLSIYEARGDYQLIVEHAEPAGEGALRQRFEALLRKLSAEGLFDDIHKRPLPTLPARIGVVTSPSGAAIRDVLNVLGRRSPATRVLIYPTPVQGEGAAEQIAATLELANRRRDCDLLILARGGGSLEDLWAFNEEVVARALFDVDIPVIVGVGHEVDMTIADFVADRRAPTPSGAAEIAVTDQRELRAALATLQRRLGLGIAARVNDRALQFGALEHRLHRTHPGVRLQQLGQRIDELDVRMRSRVVNELATCRAELTAATLALRAAAPRARIDRARERCRFSYHALAHAIGERLASSNHQIATVARALESVSPLATLARGYAIATRRDNDALVTDAGNVSKGAEVTIRLHRGRFDATVTDVERDE